MAASTTTPVECQRCGRGQPDFQNGATALAHFNDQVPGGGKNYIYDNLFALAFLTERSTARKKRGLDTGDVFERYACRRRNSRNDNEGKFVGQLYYVYVCVLVLAMQGRQRR